MIARPGYMSRIRGVFRIHPVAALLGPRQCGKTTLARLLSADEQSTTFDLESPVGRQQLAAPLTSLERLDGLVIIDEIQRQPGLYEILRVLVDRPNNAARFPPLRCLRQVFPPSRVASTVPNAPTAQPRSSLTNCRQ